MKRKYKIKNKNQFIRLTVMSLAFLILVVVLSITLVTHIITAIKTPQDVVALEPKASSIAILASDPLEATKARLRSGHTKGLKVVFLTFDDGPSEYTGEVLDILNTYQIKGTFFTVHRSGEVKQAFYRRIVEEGHTLANHTNSHSYEIYNTPDAFFADVEAQDEYQRQLTGLSETSHLFRFPGGSLTANKECIQGILDRGYNYADWNVMAGDGSGDPDPALVVENIIDGCHYQDVSIVLCHAELKPTTRAALPIVIEKLKAEGYTFLPMEKDFIYPRHLEV